MRVYGKKGTGQTRTLRREGEKMAAREWCARVVDDRTGVPNTVEQAPWTAEE